MIVVKVGKVAESGKRGMPVQEYAIDGTPTVENALKAAGIETKKLTSNHIYLNNEPVSLTTSVMNGDTVLVMPMIRGA